MNNQHVLRMCHEEPQNHLWLVLAWFANSLSCVFSLGSSLWDTTKQLNGILSRTNTLASGQSAWQCCVHNSVIRSTAPALYILRLPAEHNHVNSRRLMRQLYQLPLLGKSEIWWKRIKRYKQNNIATELKKKTSMWERSPTPPGRGLVSTMTSTHHRLAPSFVYPVLGTQVQRNLVNTIFTGTRT